MQRNQPKYAPEWVAPPAVPGEQPDSQQTIRICVCQASASLTCAAGQS
jgi:hypothetical protein